LDWFYPVIAANQAKNMRMDAPPARRYHALMVAMLPVLARRFSSTAAQTVNLALP
jgi:hypothetical protein